MRRGRPTNHFSPEELLYRRVHPDHILDGHPVPESLLSLPISVNRSAFSQERCVLCDQIYERGYDECIVTAIPVSTLPECKIGEKNFRIKAEHSPSDDNYSHCQLQIVPHRAVADLKHAKKKLKQLICDGLAIVPHNSTCPHHPSSTR